MYGAKRWPKLVRTGGIPFLDTMYPPPSKTGFPKADIRNVSVTLVSLCVLLTYLSNRISAFRTWSRTWKPPHSSNSPSHPLRGVVLKTTNEGHRTNAPCLAEQPSGSMKRLRLRNAKARQSVLRRPHAPYQHWLTDGFQAHAISIRSGGDPAAVRSLSAPAY